MRYDQSRTCVECGTTFDEGFYGQKRCRACIEKERELKEARKQMRFTKVLLYTLYSLSAEDGVMKKCGDEVVEEYERAYADYQKLMAVFERLNPVEVGDYAMNLPANI